MLYSKVKIWSFDVSEEIPNRMDLLLGEEDLSPLVCKTPRGMGDPSKSLGQSWYVAELGLFQGLSMSESLWRRVIFQNKKLIVSKKHTSRRN